MTDCKSCGMSYDKKEYDFCPYCGEVSEDEVDTPKPDAGEKQSKKAEPKRQDAARKTGSRFKLIAIGLAVVVVFAAAISALFVLDDSAVTVPGKYATIQEAIDAAEDGDEIVVGVGLYSENIDFNGKNIILRSTDPDDPDIVGDTIIDGRGSGTVVSFRSGEGEGAVLSGFTITRGSGVLISGGSSPVIEKCIIEDNTAEFGAGIAIFDSSPTIRENLIIGNSGFLGGGIFIEESSPLIEGNTIIRNRAEMGSGMVIISDSSPVVIDNRIADNVAARLGGGIVVAVNSSPTIKGNTVTGNMADRNGGGMLIEESDPIVEENTFSRNRAAYGGALFIINSLNTALLITGNNINDNLAAVAGGGLYLESSSPTIENNNISDNLSENLGGGAAIFNSSPVFQRNTFEGNEAMGPEGGGAVWVSSDSILELSDPDDNNYLLNIPDDIYREL
ncbi:MAG: right-handed parallel beta-helix repeat-containing protein [Bacillota bacterium]